MIATAAAPAKRRPASPYARRKARERGIPLEDLVGSGPAGRIVAADIEAFVPRAAPAATRSTDPEASALATTIDLARLRLLLENFAEAGIDFALDDVALRAAACALEDVPGATTLPDIPVALEARSEKRRVQIVMAGLRRQSLAPLRDHKRAAVDAGRDDAALPAALSLRIIEASDIRPVAMPLLASRPMRLVLTAGQQSAEALFVFDSGALDEDVAAEVLTRFKAYLELPVRLLA